MVQEGRAAKNLAAPRARDQADLCFVVCILFSLFPRVLRAATSKKKHIGEVAPHVECKAARCIETTVILISASMQSTRGRKIDQELPLTK